MHFWSKTLVINTNGLFCSTQAKFFNHFSIPASLTSLINVDDSIVLLQCPGQKIHDEVDDLSLMDDVVMVQIADELVCKNPDLVVTDQCVSILGPTANVFLDDQPL